MQVETASEYQHGTDNITGEPQDHGPLICGSHSPTSRLINPDYAMTCQTLTNTGRAAQLTDWLPCVTSQSTIGSWVAQR